MGVTRAVVESPALVTPEGGVRQRGAGRPPAMRGNPYVALAAFIVAVVLARELFVSGRATANLVNLWLFYVILVTGFYFVFGLSGQFAFSQAAFAAVGGYSSAWMTREEVLGTDSFWMGLVFAGVVSGVLAALFSVLMRRASHFYFAIATLGLSEIVLEVLRRWTDFTGAVGESTTGIRPITILGFEVNSAYRVFWVLLAGAAIVLLAGVLLARSPVQREVIAERDQPVVAATLGISVFRHHLVMFVLGSAIAGMAGALFVHWKGFASTEAFGITLGLGIFVMLILGGLDSLWGPVIGAAFYVFVPDWLEKLDFQLFGRDLRSYREMLFGALLVVTMVVFPEGLVGLFRRARLLVRRVAWRPNATWLSDLLRRSARPAPTPEPPPALDPDRPSVAVAAGTGANGDRPPALEATDIRVRFGGVVAVDGVSLALSPYEVLGIVGPNGSGKTTFLNALTGVVPSRGALAIGGRSVRLGRPGRARGLQALRTFQTPQTYTHLSCLDDVLLSTSDRRMTGLTSAWLLRPWMLRHERARWATAADALGRVGLADVADEPTARLSYGQRRLLELARAIAAAPRVLLLDEPSAGLNEPETDVLAHHLERLRADGISILLVDHKLDFVTGVCDRIAVLELGRVVAVGQADAVFADQRVVDAYLGVDEEA